MNIANQFNRQPVKTGIRSGWAVTQRRAAANARVYSLILGVVWLSLTASAATFTNLVNLPIPDGNPNGLSSMLNVSGLSGTISRITVSLNTIGGWNGDLYGYLSYDGGGFAVLFNRVGKTLTDPLGYGDMGFAVTFDDTAVSDFHSYGSNLGNPVSGLWQPDGRNVNPQLALDSDPRNAMLGSFNGLQPDGEWTLFVADMAGGFDSQLIGWGLEIETVPEPSSGACFVLGLVLLAALRRPRH